MSDFPIVPELSSCQVPVSFLDEDGNPYTPSSVDYRLDCQTTGKNILAWTSAAPAANIIITITPQQNAIINENNAFETKFLTVRADSGLPSQLFGGPYIWDVQNLPGVP